MSSEDHDGGSYEQMDTAAENGNGAAASGTHEETASVAESTAANENTNGSNAAAAGENGEKSSEANASDDGDSRPRIYVTRLPPTWGNLDARTFFGKYGPVTDTVVFRDPQTRRTRYAFVEFATKADALHAIEQTHNLQVEGAPLDVKMAAPKPNGSRYGPKHAVEQPPAASSASSNPYNPISSFPQPGQVTDTRLYVGNIGSGTLESEVKTEFEKFGPLVSCSMWLNKRAAFKRGPNAPPSFSAYVQYEKHADAKAAKIALDAKNILRGNEPQLLEKDPNFPLSEPLIVDFAKPIYRPTRPAYQSGGGDYYRGGGGSSYGDRDRRYDDRRGGYDDRRYDDRGSSSRYDDRSSSRYYDDRSSSRYDDRSSSSRYDDRYSSSSSSRYDDRDRYSSSKSSSSYRSSSDYPRRERSRSRERERERSPRR